MENNTQELHVQKVAILSRLVKESSLTLEEALLLLKEEEQVKKTVTVGNSGYGTTSYPPLGTWSSSGIGTYVVPPSFISMSGTTITNTAVDDTATLNN